MRHAFTELYNDPHPRQGSGQEMSHFPQEHKLPIHCQRDASERILIPGSLPSLLTLTQQGPGFILPKLQLLPAPFSMAQNKRLPLESLGPDNGFLLCSEPHRTWTWRAGVGVPQTRWNSYSMVCSCCPSDAHISLARFLLQSSPCILPPL